MANRRRLDPGLLEEVKGFIRDQLEENGDLTGFQKQLLREHLDRSESSIERLVRSVAGQHSLKLPRLNRKAVANMPALEAFLDGQPFSFADKEMRRVATAYAGNLAKLHRDGKAAAGQLGLSGPVCYVQLTRKFNAELAEDERAVIRKGIAGFKKASLYRRWSALHRNMVWQIDATKGDIWVRVHGTETYTRPDVLLIVEDFSRVILAAVLMTHDYTADDAAAAVHRAMRMRDVTLPDGQVIQVGGKPDTIYCDNAQQFVGELMSHVSAIVGFVMWAVAIYMGEAKGKVERMIRSVNEELFKTLPGYANPNLHTLTQKDALRGRQEDFLTDRQLADELAKWVEAKNNSEHPRRPGQSRYEVYAADSAPLIPVPDEMLVPATVALPRASYKYHGEGFVVQREKVKRNYISLPLAGRVGQRFLLRHLPGDTDWVDAYELDGQFICRC